jgi:hypothetical protein
MLRIGATPVFNDPRRGEIEVARDGKRQRRSLALR